MAKAIKVSKKLASQSSRLLGNFRKTVESAFTEDNYLTLG